MSEPVSPEELERIEGLVAAARERLVESEEGCARLHALLESILSVVPPLVAVDERVVVAWSAELERVSGVPAPSALGRPVTSVLPSVGPLDDGVHLVECHDGGLRLHSSAHLLVNVVGGGFASARAPG